MREIPQIDWGNSNRELTEDLNEFYKGVKENIDDLQENAFKKDRDNFARNALCLRSPDGTWYKLTVSDGGTISSSSIQQNSAGEPTQTSNPYAT